MHSKDILNIKQAHVRETVGGLTRGQLLANALKDLTLKTHATEIIDVDASDNVE